MPLVLRKNGCLATMLSMSQGQPRSRPSLESNLHTQQRRLSALVGMPLPPGDSCRSHVAGAACEHGLGALTEGVRARRILLKASNGVVAGNTFTEPKFTAAQITPEFYFQEADFSSNLTVQGNVFNSYYAGVVLGFISDGSGLPGAFQNHVNVTISNNLIMVRATRAASPRLRAP